LQGALLVEEWKRYDRHPIQGEADWSIQEQRHPQFPTCSNPNKSQ
jgi:hypothetical protein